MIKNKIVLFLGLITFSFLSLLWSAKVIAEGELQVVTLGDGVTDYVLPYDEEESLYKADLVFNFQVREDSQTYIENLISTGYDNLIWENNIEGDILHIVNNLPTYYDETIIADSVYERSDIDSLNPVNLTLIKSNDKESFRDTLYAGGEGTEVNPYIIGNCQQLQNINYTLHNEGPVYYTLSKNIDCQETRSWNNGAGFLPLGDTYKDENDEPSMNKSLAGYESSFDVYLDGNNHVVSNLFINRPDNLGVGLFGGMENMVIKNIGLTDVNITGLEGVGALAGNLQDGLIENSYSTGIVSGKGGVGGLIGRSTDNHIENTYSLARVSGEGDIGGLVGINYANDLGDTIVKSYAKGEVTGKENVGGLVGYNSGDNITTSYATGKVTGTISVGGLVGLNSGYPSPIISQSYATGEVFGISKVGGLVGENEGGHIENTYARGKVTGNGRVGGLVGSTKNATSIINSYAIGNVSGNQYVGGLVGEDMDDYIVNSYSVGNVSGSTYTGGLVGYFRNYKTSHDLFIYNSGWYKQNQKLSGVGYDYYLKSSAEVNHVVLNYQDLYSSQHGVYIPENDEEESSWNFDGIWTEQANDYPLLTNNYEQRDPQVPEALTDNDIIRLSLSDYKIEGNDDSLKYGGSYDISKDGRYVAFVSRAENLTADDDNTAPDVFVYDTKNKTIKRIYALVGDGEDQREISCENDCYISMSDNGQYLAIGTAMGEGMGIVLFFDLNNINNVKLVSTEGVYGIEDMGSGPRRVAAEGEGPFFPYTPYPSLSGDGKELLVSSPLIDGESDIYYFNLEEEEKFSSFGLVPPMFYRSSISKDGQYFVFGTNSGIMAVNKELAFGLIGLSNDEIYQFFIDNLISIKPDGEPFNPEEDMLFGPFISKDGRYVTFSVYNSQKGGGYSTIYLHDRQQKTTTKIFQSENSLLNYYVSSMSDDARFIVFSSSARSLAMPLGKSPIYVYDRENQEVKTLVEGLNHNGVSISGDGKYVSFASIANDLVSDDNNNSSDVFFMENIFYTEDVCPNIDGTQTDIPEGKYRNSQGDCVNKPTSGSKIGGGGSGSHKEDKVEIIENQQDLNTLSSSCIPGYFFDPFTGKACTSFSNQISTNQINQSGPLTFLRILKEGMRGDDVKSLQVYLNTHNFNCGLADGIFGKLTKQAVIQFQSVNNVKADGIVGPITRALFK